MLVSKPLLGTTYSHREVANLKLSHRDSFATLLDFQFDIIRLCVYWNEVQPAKNVFDFTIMEQMLDLCEKNGQKVVLTIGMKAPRWPEFYIPGWAGTSPNEADEHVLHFLEQAVHTFQNYSCITHWQVENEPLDPSGPENVSITKECMEKEITLVKSLDPRPVIMTLWGNELVKRGNGIFAKEHADVIGIDLYFKYPENSKFEFQDLAKELKTLEKSLWITELQAEPW